MTSDLFDLQLRALRRDRAARMGPELFLLDRAFDDCLDRLSIIRREFRSALLLGCPSPSWPAKLRERCPNVTIFDPGRLFALGAGGSQSDEVSLPLEPGQFDLIIAIGTIDTANDIGSVLLRLRLALEPGGLLLGAMSGAETLPVLRAAMRAADLAIGVAAPHVHPRIEPAGMATLLNEAGFAMPVVDVDRISVSYRSLSRLVRDLRAMGATNVLKEGRKLPLPKKAFAAAEAHFLDSAEAGRTTETFAILNFAGWAPEEQRSAAQV